MSYKIVEDKLAVEKVVPAVEERLEEEFLTYDEICYKLDRAIENKKIHSDLVKEYRAMKKYYEENYIPTEEDNEN